MTDLLLVLPDFDTAAYSHIIPSLERALITASDILTLDSLDVAKRASVPSAEVRRLKDDLSTQLHGQLAQCHAKGLFDTDWALVSTLDPALDRLLGGGFPAGYLSEITGERYGSCPLPLYHVH
ncbi:hypothetical protein K461DRAFT_275246 [Myriangium duriaei CBS 260.36]|uniref:Uncharacterized protein n=1 Tax=Myriangium duriaei CBS 260.36 TaxID=1168546 RepID=A0A9P4JAJ8_9PEZI|nr:hypothetical protein K461DRAFT_275246 [Myriangium duriaei CBS 260.36]